MCVREIIIVMEFINKNVSDELLGTVVPLVVYWAYSGIYLMFGSLENYRLHSKKEEDDKNCVSKTTVVKGVLLQQAVQAIVAIILFTVSTIFYPHTHTHLHSPVMFS